MKQNKLLHIMPECFVDTNLIEYLLNAGVNHQHCCSKVVGQLNSTFADKFAIGIIDKDKVQLGYIRECDIIAQTEHLTLMKHRERHQYLITIAPAVDKFILDCAEEQMIDPNSFGLPTEFKKFTDESKKVSSNSDPRFKSLFAAIKDNSEIHSLKMALKYLCENRYTPDSAHLKEIFVGQ
ncbi:hypothetical protein AB9N12_19540 [Bacteroides sp. AN502(2024)]|uniref:hypothetical protein n=1 Tax=Bacteroides sp. AN502(2024) TaxID=3160599 RepID=UPI0035111575